MIRIALITYDISPFRGSEASVSWNFVREMSRHVHLTVIYATEKHEINSYIQSKPLHNITWINIPKQIVKNDKFGIKEQLQHALYYRRWHKQVYRYLSKKVEENDFDLIHYLNPIGFKEPGYSWKIKNIPYVWGPIQAVDNRPLRLCAGLGLRILALAIARRIIHNSLFMFSPRVRKALKRSDAIFAATPATVREMKHIYGLEVPYLPENGITEMETSAPVILSPNQKLNLIWIGVMNEYRKGFDILLDSLTQVNSTNWHIDIFGKGDINPKNKQKVQLLGDHITIHGKVARGIVQETFKNSHLHLITSLGEATTTVIWEAMANAVPTMTLDHCGMAGVVCEKCGIKIHIDSYKRVTSNIAAHIDNIIDNPSEIERLSAGVIECSKKFMWDNRIGIFFNTYQRLIASKH